MSTEVEIKARDLGWLPKEEFRGDPDRWIDAETFVKRGEELMPLLKANNRKLLDEVQSLKAVNAKTENLLRAAQESIEELKNFNTAIARERAKDKKKELVTALAEARREGDVESEIHIQEQLQEQTAALREAEKPAAKKADEKPAQPEQQQTQEFTPTFKKWMGENPWFMSDKRKTALAMGIAEELRADPATRDLPEAAFLDRVSEEVSKTLGNPMRQSPSKVEGEARGSGEGGGGASGGGGRKKSYADLPADVKAVCDRQAARLVGEGRAFKKIEDWRSHYAREYFEE
ncbi:MAG: hypothetical protein SFV24_19125 [Gemmatimonadales bacterium]|nr:hypothetical protein [Gemmatimonadales bacterium]